MEIIKQRSMETAKQNSKDVNVQKCNSAMKRFSGEAMPHRIAGVQTYTGIVAPMRTNIVVPTQISTVVLSYDNTDLLRQ
jgi:hypothetical protein